MNEITEAERIRQRIFRSIDRLSENPDVLEAGSSYGVLADYHLKMLAKTNPRYVPGVKRELVNLL